LIDFCFGADSFARHCQQIEASLARLEIIRMPSLAFDLDIPEDLLKLQELKSIRNKFM
jgi:2-phospho-L-lactate guanylyltransferase (CobY/MobA/RfbA family)